MNTLRLRQNCCHFTDDIFKCIFLNENVKISQKSSLKLVPKVRINNIAALVQIMVWCPPGNKPLSESMMVMLCYVISCYVMLCYAMLCYSENSDIIKMAFVYSWWNRDVEMPSTLLALCERVPSVVGGFPAHRASNAGSDAFCVHVSLHCNVKTCFL